MTWKLFKILTLVAIAAYIVFALLMLFIILSN